MSRILALAALLALAPGAAGQSGWIAVPQQVQEFKLLHQPQPVYPDLAKKGRIQGVVRLYVLIGRDGTVERIRLMSGHPFLVPAAMDAVKKWQYRPTYQFGVPVRVMTTVEVHFTLGIPESDGPPHKATRV
jgi:protein TonB